MIEENTNTTDLSNDDFINSVMDDIDDNLVVVDKPATDEKVKEETPKETEVKAEEESEEDYLADVDAEEEEDVDTPEDNSETEEEEKSDDVDNAEVTLKVDGEDITITMDELKKGYSRQSDYTKKTQELAEQRKALEAEEKTLEYLKVQSQFQPKVFELQELQKQIDIAEKAIHTGRTEDGTELSEKGLEETKKNVDNARRRLNYESEELNKKMKDTPPPMLDKLQERVPELFSDDEKVRGPVLNTFAAELKEVGFSQAEINAVNDPRILLLVKQASEGRSLAERVAKAKARKSKTPGPVSKSTKSSNTKTKQSFSKSDAKESGYSKHHKAIKDGDMTNVADFLEDLL